MTPINIFLDSDVVISSVLSKNGSAHFILASSMFECFVSNYSTKELRKVAERTDLDFKSIKAILDKNTKTSVLRGSLKSFKKEYGQFVRDEDDAHIVAGAHKSKSKFLLTYNAKHYDIDKIKAELGITVIKPGNFLQYLRSQNKYS